MSSQDYAILVGIKDYADSSFPGLNGPLSDVALMKTWLTSASGGNLDSAHITTIESPVPLPHLPARQMPPLSITFWNAFQDLVLDTNNRAVPRPDSRLYLYFSGHGFSQIRDQMPRASLYTANANPNFCDNIAGTFCALWTKDRALFRDIVIIMDCCRNAEFSRSEAHPALNDIPNVGASANVEVFGIYAAPKGGAAQERKIPSRNNVVYGLLTHAVVDALENARSDSSGAVTSTEVAEHIRSRWSAICGSEPADPPEFAYPTVKPVVLVTRTARVVPQRLVVSSWLAGETVELFDGAGQPLATLVRDAAGAAVSVKWASRPPETVPVAGGRITIQLSMGLYKLTRNSAKNLFQAGDDDVTV